MLSVWLFLSSVWALRIPTRLGHLQGDDVVLQFGFLTALCRDNGTDSEAES